MAYFVALYDKDFETIKDGDIVTHPIDNFTLKRKAFEMDDFSCECEAIANLTNVMYVGLHDETGSLKYLCLSGVPVVEDGLTSIQGSDVRHIFKQEIPVDLSSTNYYWYSSNRKTKNVAKLFEYLLNRPKDLLDNLGIEYAVDVSPLERANIQWQEEVSEDGTITQLYTETYGVIDLWDTLMMLCSAYNCTILVRPSLTPGIDAYGNPQKHINIVVEPINKLIRLKLEDFETRIEPNFTDTNSVLCGCSDDTTRTLYKFYRLSNNDIVQAADLDDRYTDDDSFAQFDGRCIYSGRRKREFLIYPEVCKTYLDEADKDEIGGGISADGIQKGIQDAISEGLNCLMNARYQESIELKMTTAFSQQALSVMFRRDVLDTTENEDYTLAFNYMGQLYGYNVIAKSAKVDNTIFKLLPVSEIEEKVDEDSHEISITFGKLSDYWWINGNNN